LGPLAAVAAAGALVASLFVAPLGRAAHAPSAEGQRLAVATDNADATRAAFSAMEAGGNAADGAIAAALALGVVSPSSSGIGGGGFVLVYRAKDRAFMALDFREIAPAKLDVDMLAARDWRNEDPSKRGVSIGVPGEPAGLEWLSRKFAKRPLAEDAAPAVALAERGFLVGRNVAVVTGFVKDRLAASTELSAQFVPGGVPVAFGARVKRPDLARTLRRFGAEGSRPFYDGDIAQKIARAAQRAGGQLEAADLAAYRVKERAPLERTIDGRRVVTMPAPSAGGLMLLETLTMYGASGASALKPMGFGSSAYLHAVAEAMRGAVGDRARFASDPDAEPSTGAAYDAALAPAQIEARKKRIDPRKTHRAAEFRTREQGTTHLIVVDAEGNIVSLTTTVNAPFGARVVVENTGIVLNDELDDFTSPKDLAGFGVVGLGPNRARPGARPVSSMTPTIVLENGEPILALGGSGGERIATAVTQMTLCRLVFGLDPAACLASSRIHVNASADVTVEPDMTEDVRAGLKARGEQLKDVSIPIAPAVQIVAWERGAQTRVLAASDPRKAGFAAAQ
jgi:gamma-glutamyltranspeptidase / glutathione hydrolase